MELTMLGQADWLTRGEVSPPSVVPHTGKPAHWEIALVGSDGAAVELEVQRQGQPLVRIHGSDGDGGRLRGLHLIEGESLSAVLKAVTGEVAEIRLTLDFDASPSRPKGHRRSSAPISDEPPVSDEEVPKWPPP
jgi:hypothetical protein